MLLSASIDRPATTTGLRTIGLLRLLSGLDLLPHDVAIGVEPVRHRNQSVALYLEDPYPAAPFVIGRGDPQRRDQTAQCEIVDLLHALLHVGPGRRRAVRQFERVPQCLDLDRRTEDAAVVVDSVVHARRWRLAVLLIHRLDRLTDRVVVAGAGELHRVVALSDPPAARRRDVGFARRPN